MFANYCLGNSVIVAFNNTTFFGIVNARAIGKTVKSLKLYISNLYYTNTNSSTVNKMQQVGLDSHVQTHYFKYLQACK